MANEITKRMPGGFVTGFAQIWEPHELIESPRRLRSRRSAQFKID